jgi:hypothetical protein
MYENRIQQAAVECGKLDVVLAFCEQMLAKAEESLQSCDLIDRFKFESTFDYRLYRMKLEMAETELKRLIVSSGIEGVFAFAGEARRSGRNRMFASMYESFAEAETTEPADIRREVPVLKMELSEVRLRLAA